MIDVRQLRHFLAVIEHGGIRQAARAIPLSPSAVARSISMLENHYGLELLSRDKQRILPTAFGVRLAEDAKSLVAGFDGIDDRLAQLANLEVGSLRVGIGPAMSAVLMPATARRMAHAHPRVKLEVSHDHADRNMHRLRNHELDVAVGLQDPFVMDGRCDVTPLYIEAVQWWVREGHPLADRRRLSAADLARFPIVSQLLPTPAKEWLDEIGRQARNERGGAPITCGLQCNDYDILMRLTLESDAVLLSPRHTVRQSRYANQLASIPGPAHGEAVVSAAFLRFPSPSPLALRFVQVLQETTRDLLDTAVEAEVSRT